MRSHTTQQIRDFLVRHIPKDPRGVAKLAATQFGITRQAVNRHLRELTEEGVVVASGETRAREYSLKTEKHSETYQLTEDLEEGPVWTTWARPKLEGSSENVLYICHYGLTEILNNAKDHSEGKNVTVTIESSAATVRISVFDDGIGIFRKIKQAFQLPFEQDALLELSKGKLTTDPDYHSGEGIFFTSRMFDEFSIWSHRLVFHHIANASTNGDFLREFTDCSKGTLVDMRLDKQTEREPLEVYDRFASDYSFDITHVPVSLATHGDEKLVSRSQAKRLVARFGGFKRVILNFEGVDSIGQSFADEVFRVFRRENPETKIEWVNAADDVEKMIRRAYNNT